MLNLIIGPKGSGKTEKAHSVLGECVRNGGNAMLIVPKQFTFESDKGILHLLGPRLACEVEVLSFTRLSHIAVEKYGGITKPILKSASRLILMSIAVSAIEHELHSYRKHTDRISFITSLVKQIDEMKRAGVEPEELEKTASQLKDKLLSQKLREIALVYRSFNSVVSESFFDDADMLKRVYELLSGTDFFKGKTIAIDGFSSFSFYEMKLIELMMKQADNVYITLCTDNDNDVSMSSVFSCVNKTARKLKLIAGNNNVTMGDRIILRRKEGVTSEDIEHLHNNIYLPVCTPFEGESDNVTVVKCPTPTQECDYIARKIKSFIREGKYRCRDIAVVYRSGDEYESAMKLSLKKYDVPHFEDKRQPVMNQPLISFVSSLLSICSEGFSSDNIFRYLKTSLVLFSVEEISEIENYAFTWDIDGTKWLQQWEFNPDGFGYEMNEKRVERLAKLNALRQRIIEPVSAFKEKMKNASGKEGARYIYEFLRENKVDKTLKEYALMLEKDGMNELAIEQEQVWDLLMQVLDEMAVTLGDTSVGIKRFSELFSLVMSEKSLGKLPDGFDEVYICTADRILTKSARVVFVAGLNEGVFPLVHKESGLIFFREKLQLSRMGLELSESVKELTAQERFLVYCCLAAAKEKLFLCYSMASASGDKNTKSEVVTMVQNILPSAVTEDALQQEFEELIESERSAFELMSSRWHFTDGKTEALKKYFSEKAEYKSRMESIIRAVSDEDFAINDKDTAKKLFGKDMNLSASQLEVYGNCPFMYFCRYGLNAKKRQSARLDPAQSGTVVHYVLENILKNHKGKEFLRLGDDKIDEEISFYLNEYINTNMGGAQDKTERFNYLFFRMKKILSNIFDRLVAEFTEGDFEPCDFELKIDEDGDVKPDVIHLKDGSVRLRGVIDRVDKMDLNEKRYIRVVDYKTGVKEFLLSDVLSGLNMQMLLYLMSIWKNGTGFYENIVPSGVLYFPARMSTYNASREDTPEQDRDKSFASGKMNGMLVGDDEIIGHMEKEPYGRFVPVKMDSRSKKLKGNFISIEQLRRLGEKMDAIIADMGNSLHNGFVPARPAFGPGHSETCTYCDYSDICLKDDPKYRYIPKLNHDESIRTIMGGEQDEQKLDS